MEKSYSPLSKIRSITAGDHHTCAVRTDSKVFCWGMGANGRLGNELQLVINEDGIEETNPFYEEDRHYPVPVLEGI